MNPTAFFFILLSILLPYMGTEWEVDLTPGTHTPPDEDIKTHVVCRRCRLSSARRRPSARRLQQRQRHRYPHRETLGGLCPSPRFLLNAFGFSTASLFLTSISGLVYLHPPPPHPHTPTPTLTHLPRSTRILICVLHIVQVITGKGLRDAAGIADHSMSRAYGTATMTVTSKAMRTARSVRLVSMSAAADGTRLYLLDAAARLWLLDLAGQQSAVLVAAARAQRPGTASASAVQAQGRLAAPSPVSMEDVAAATPTGHMPLLQSPPHQQLEVQVGECCVCLGYWGVRVGT